MRRLTPAELEVLTDAAIEAFDDFREVLSLANTPVVYEWSNRLTASAGLIGFKSARGYYHIRLSVPIFKGVLLRDGWTAADAAVRRTMAHELSHICRSRYGRTNGHGAEWRDQMKRCGYVPRQTHSYAYGAELFGAGDFSVGDAVEFEYKGEWYLGEIVKKNVKKAKVQLSDGTIWNVPYSRME